MSLPCDLEDSKPVFFTWHPGWQWSITTQKVQQCRRYVWTNVHWKFEHSLWPWPWTQQSNLFTRHPSLWWHTIKLCLVARDQKLKTCSRNSCILITWALTMTMTLKFAHHSFPITLQLMMMHHHTTFCYKRLCDLEVSVRTKPKQMDM